MSKEVDIKKLKKEDVRAKRKAIATKSKKNADIADEEKELKVVKSEYDKSEYIRRKLLNDLVSKDLTDDRFARLYDKFYEEYMDNDDMELFMILVRLSYDYDTKEFVKLINNVLKSIKSKEAGALVKGKKGSVNVPSNFYETSAILELLYFIDGKENVITQYNKKKFSNSSGDYKIVDKFGKIEQTLQLQKRLLENIYQSSVRLSNMWRKKIEKDIGIKGKKYKEVPYDEKELILELEDERLRYNFLSLSLSREEEDSKEFFSKLDSKLSNSNNNELFFELLYLYNISDIKDFQKYIEDTLQSYDENHNTILALLEIIKNTKVLKDRYSNVRKAIKPRGELRQNDEFLTLENKYGSLEDLFDMKKMEFFLMEKRMKYDEIKKEDIKDIKGIMKEKEVIDEEESEEDSNGDSKEDSKKVKDSGFYPLKAPKDKGTGKVERKIKKKSSEREYMMYNLDTKLKDFSKENLEKIRNTSIYFLKKFFDTESSKDMEKNIYQEYSENTLRSYLTRLGKLIILVDQDGIKHLSKLLNERLSVGYYDVKDLLSLSYKELLQDIYADPRNKDFIELDAVIDFELNRFFKKFVKFLGFIEDISNLSDSSDSSDNIGKNYDNIYRIDNIEPCNIDFKKRSVFKEYLRLKNAYNLIDQDNPKEKLQALKTLLEEEKKIRTFLMAIVYYRENEELYCFTYSDLEEKFNEKDYINTYTGHKFSQDFIDDLNIVINSKKEKVKKFVEEDEQEEIFLRNIFDDINELESDLKNKDSKDNACAYYKKFVFSSSRLEKMMKKDKPVIDGLKSFCGYESTDPIRDPIPRSIPEPISDPIPRSIPEPISDPIRKSIPESKSPRSNLSIPSIVFDEDLKEKKKDRSEILLPMLRSRISSSVMSEQPEKDKSEVKKDKKKLLEMLAQELEKD